MEQDQSSLPSFGSKQQILFVSHDEVPALEDSKKVSLIKSLLAQRADMEVVSGSCFYVWILILSF